MTAGPSLYRRHRPRSFADVVGQEHVVRTLRNAIERDKVHHAYLFVGARGTGKTSMAKILAASLNCQRGGPTATPCGECESCVAIASATSLDVIEMDAASNNSVDDIRELREKVAYAPLSGSHKVYILDEAHMLSTQAWNAFLKTLEEPPPHTVFVLATTEANKVLPTVVDRCHRFDFTRPTVDQIAGVLRRVATAEEITVPDEATALIARSATGSFRDALGTLEQLVTYSGSSVALEDVLAVLGAADSDLLFGTVDAVASASPREALLAAGRLAESGRDVGRFFTDLEDHARGLLICQALGATEVPPELAVSPEHDARLLVQAAAVPRADVIRLLDLLAAGLHAIKDGSDPRIQLELALVKATEPAGDHSTRALIARIERLEVALARGGAPPAGAAPAAAKPAPATPAPASAPASASPGIGPATAAGQASREAAPVKPAPEASASAPAAGAPTVAEPAPPPAREAAPEQASGEPAIGAPAAEVSPDAPAEPAAAPAPPAPDPPTDAAGVWGAALEGIGVEEPHVAALLHLARPLAVEEDELRLAWPRSQSFSMKRAEAPETRALVTEAVRAVAGRPLRLAYELRPDEELGEAEPEMSDDDLVARFVAEFDATELPPDAEKTPTAPKQEGT